MQKQERREITETKKVVVAVVCDNCGKEHLGSEAPNDWHSFSGHHNEWGNDSVDSWEEYDVCSPKCYKEKLAQVVNDLDGYASAKINDMTIDFAKKLVTFLDAKKL